MISNFRTQISVRTNPIPLTPKAVEILRVLIEQRGQVVERDELMNAVWPDVAVEDGNLSVTVSMLRKVLAEHSPQKFIETFPKRGYKFTADVREVVDSAPGILVEKQTLGRFVIDEDFSLTRPSMPKLFSSTRRKLATATAAAATVVLLIGGFIYFSRSETARARNAGSGRTAPARRAWSCWSWWWRSIFSRPASPASRQLRDIHE